MKGGEKERFNPLTGLKYERLQSHDVNDPDDNPTASTSTITTVREHVSKKGRGGYFSKGEDRQKWRGRGRQNSPYHRNTSESTSKTVEVQAKSKDK